jgi:hypothetical protein
MTYLYKTIQLNRTSSTRYPALLEAILFAYKFEHFYLTFNINGLWRFLMVVQVISGLIITKLLLRMLCREKHYNF